MNKLLQIMGNSEQSLHPLCRAPAGFGWVHYSQGTEILTFSVISLSQESILSLNKSSVLPLLLLKLLLWKSCLKDQKDNYFA